MPSPISSSGSCPKQGFTLIEVLLALAVAGFTMITLLTLMALSLSLMSDARDDAIYSQIGEQTLSIIQSSRYDEVQNLPSVRYFDGDGRPLSSATGAVYRAELTIEDNPSSTTLPNMAKAELMLRRVGQDGSHERLYHSWIMKD